MTVFNNLKGINQIFCNGKEIMTVRINNKAVFQNDRINPSYNYFVFDTKYVGTGSVTIALANYRAGDYTSWDRKTDWGDGTVDTNYIHTYEEPGVYTVKTKWMIYHRSSFGTYSADPEARSALVGCDNINKNITDVANLFSACEHLKTVDMSRFRTDNITDMNRMFYNCVSLEELKNTGWDTSRVTNMSEMFNNCRKLSPKVDHFNVSSVTDMFAMFRGCENLDGSQFKKWRPTSAEHFGYLFYNAVVTTNRLDLSEWNVSNINGFPYMFYNCEVCEKIDISGWNIKSLANVTNMFARTQCNYCKDLEHHVIHNNVPQTTWERMKKG